MRARTQQLEPRLVADLDAPAGEQGDAPSQVGQFRAFAEIELCAGRAQLVVEVVDELVLLFADVAMLWLWARSLIAAGAVFQFGDVLCREADRWEECGRSEDRFAAQRANTGLVQNGITLACVRGTAFTCGGLSLVAAQGVVRVMNTRNGLEQAFAIGRRQGVDDAGVAGDLFKQHRGGAQSLEQVVLWLWWCGGAFMAHLWIFNGHWKVRVSRWEQAVR